MSFRSFLAAGLLFAATHVFATPQLYDNTGLWVDPETLGWGISIYHQGDTMFASLFVYGPDGAPRWYTASALVGGPNQYTGSLTEASGPYLGASSFDSGAVTRRTVGTMTILINGGGGRGSVSYTIDGTHVSRPISRFTMKPVNLTANYIGAVVQPGSGEKLVLDQHININDTAVKTDIFTDSNRTGSCSYYGDGRSQSGVQVYAGGFGVCGPGQPSQGWTATLDPTPHGFTGIVSWVGPAGQMSYSNIAAAKRTAPSLQGTGYIDDLWFPPNEAGWGLNLIDQGDTAFATLFVYDAQNRPHWYSASQLKAGTTNGRPSWSGNVEESNGPYFGGAFDPSQVTRRVVGTMTFVLQENGDGSLSYTVNGVTVVKTVRRFAFRRNDLSGSYQGSVVMRTDDPRGGSYDDASFTIDDQGDRVNMHVEILTGPTCDYTLQSIQYGAQRSLYGDYSCAGRQGRIEMNDLLVTAQGLTGSYQGPAGHIGGVITNGNISGARR